MRTRRIRSFAVAVALLATGLPLVLATPPATAVPNPVATTDAAYTAFGRVFPDPQGCEASMFSDSNGDGIKDTPVGISPWAKGRVCTAEFLTYSEVIQGSRFLQSKFPRYLEVVRLDREYDNPEYMSAGLPKTVALENGEVKVLGRERRPLYLFKVTDAESDVPEAERHHFAYSLSIHGIERAGLEGGIRAMEDLITWAACAENANAAPACAVEGPFPKRIVETPTDKPVPTAGEVLENSVIYFIPPNPDGWGRGELSPVELEDEDPPLPNTNYTPNAHFQRYNGNGVDLNRDWPTVGYTYRPYSPGSEPETRAYSEVLSGIRDETANGRFTGGLDLHGQLLANAFSFTLLGASQKDYRKNFSTVDQSLRTWQDQTQRLAWSPYIGDANRDGVHQNNEQCPTHNTVVFGSGNIPYCIADQWGTVIDTIDYQITGGFGDWIESPIGLGAVGIDNEMSMSHFLPDTVYDPINEQMHIDGNKGLIFSQLSSMLTEQDADYVYDPPGKIGYVFNPLRVEHAGSSRPGNEANLPAQDRIDAYMPCAGPACDGATFAMDGASPTLEFDVKGPSDGVWNGGITVQVTFPNVNGISQTGPMPRFQLQTRIENQWQTVATSFVQGGGTGATVAGVPVRTDLYQQAGQVVSANDPAPGRWRVRAVDFSGGSNMAAASAGTRVDIRFERQSAEASPGQAPFSASSMDFFADLNKYIADPADHAEAVTVNEIVSDPQSLDRFDSLVVVNRMGVRSFLTGTLGVPPADATAYFSSLGGFAERGGNLVLTDEGLKALVDLGIAAPREIASNQPLWGSGGRGAAPRYEFNVPSRGNLCTPTIDDALVEDVCLPGSAGGTLRQAVEPVPIGYVPDATLDGDASVRLREWVVNTNVWQFDCGKQNVNHCTSALLATRVNAQNVPGQTGLGERHQGEGAIRIAGALLPDPLYSPGGAHDMRFGLGSYALTFSGWQIFLNLVDYQRPPPPPPPDADLSVALSDAPDPVVEDENVTYGITAANAGPNAAENVSVKLDLPSGAALVSAPQGCNVASGTVTCALGTLSAGQSTLLQIVATAEQSGSLVATASITGTVTDLVPANDSVTETTTAGCTITASGAKQAVDGTAGRDIICGSARGDVIRGLGGDDVIFGGGGADSIAAGPGHDRVHGGDVGDSLKGGDGDDAMYGEAGNDGLNGGNGTDSCDVGADGGTTSFCE